VTRVFLIASSGRERERLGELLEDAGAEVVGTAASADGAAEELLELADVLVLEANDEPLEEILATLQLEELPADVPVVLVVAQQRAPNWASLALRSRVRGILPRTLAARSLRAALEAVTQGLTVLHLSHDSWQRTDSDTAELVEALTGREREVLEMLAQGRGNKDIATRLKISEHTVKFHVASILGKLGAGTRTEAVSIALRRGLILF
jgi:NarL family two-component system response regulator YdfI